MFSHLAVLKDWLAQTVHADNNVTSVGINIPGANHMTGSGYSSWQNYLSDIYRFSLNIGSSLAVLMIVYSGILYLTSRGDSTKINTAKEYTIGALIGLAMLYMIKFLSTVLGVGGIAK